MADNTPKKNQRVEADSADRSEPHRWERGRAPWDRPPPQVAHQVPEGKTMAGFNPAMMGDHVLPFKSTPDPGPPDVHNDFEVWASVSAKLLKRSASEQQRILDDLALGDIWTRANDRWSAALAEDFIAERDTRPKHYSAVCAEEMKRRRAGADELEAQQPSFIQVEPRVGEVAIHTELVGGEDDEPPTMARPPQMIGPLGPDGPRIDFIDRLAPPDIQPEAPKPGQKSTEAQDMRSVSAALRAANKALSWPVEKFAELCAEIDHDPERTTLIAANYGLRGEAIDFVREGWQERLAADPRLHQQWSELVARYREGIQHRRPKPPSSRQG